MEKEVCGRCMWHRYESTGDWSCNNEDSEFYTDYTEYKDSCDEFEERS